MKTELKKQIRQKEKEREALLLEYKEAKALKNEVRMISIVSAGKKIKTDLEILRRRLKALDMGKKRLVEVLPEIKKDPVVIATPGYRHD